MYMLYYFKESKDGICADDFKNQKEYVLINMNFLISLSNLKNYITPFSSRFIGKYAIVTMADKSRYFIDEQSFDDLKQAISRKYKGRNEEQKVR